MDQALVRERLDARRKELEQNLNRYGANSLDTGATDVQDEMDRVITSGAQATSLELNTIEYGALRDVEAALVRLDEGTYGRCVVCGREIGEARLRAIPETPYCIDHADQAEGTASSL